MSEWGGRDTEGRREGRKERTGEPRACENAASQHNMPRMTTGISILHSLTRYTKSRARWCCTDRHSDRKGAIHRDSETQGERGRGTDRQRETQTHRQSAFIVGTLRVPQSDCVVASGIAWVRTGTHSKEHVYNLLPFTPFDTDHG